MAINDTQFAGLVLLIVADRLGVRAVRAWEAEWGTGKILSERRWLADPDDAALCAERVAGMVAEFAAGDGEAA